MKAVAMIKIGDFFQITAETKGGSKLRMRSTAKTREKAQKIIDDLQNANPADLLPREGKSRHINGSDFGSVVAKMAKKGQWSQPFEIEETPRVDLEKQANSLLFQAGEGSLVVKTAAIEG